EVVNRRDKLGKLAFPRLRQSLVTRWGKYAWYKGNFDLDQNLLVAPTTYRGRPVSDINIQDYVSEIVSKYLPAGVSPWQVVIIPATDVQHYLLLRIHHVMINEGLNIADLLPLVPPARHNGEAIGETKTPLVGVCKTPQSLPCLKERLQQDLTNLWNEFISNYDPLEQPELLKRSPGVFQYMAVVLITSVSIFKEMRKGYPMIKNDIFSKLKYFNATFVRETNRRQVTFSNFLNAVFETLHPINIIKGTINWWYCGFVFTLKIPLLFYYEIMAFYSCLTLQYCRYSNTMVGFVYNYVPLLYSTGKEICYYLKLLIQAPNIVLEQLLFEPETIQTIPPCGRKVVAWSEPVKTELIRKIAKHTAVSETELLLATVSVTIARYCCQAGIIVPTEIPVTIRNVSSNYVFLSGTNVKPQDAVSGLLGLRLPVLNAEKDETLLENLRVIKQNFANAIETQPVSYLLTTLQTKYGVLTNALPATAVEVILKYLSRKYTISITEITSKHPNITQRTIWGHEVTSAIYWRPPQANMSISLCFNQYGDSITLGVMCDAQVLPYHPVLARDFSDHIEDLAMAVGID
ncbi:hypothetical protein ILUMI_09594, partial [Ignelater luminosus]